MKISKGGLEIFLKIHEMYETFKLENFIPHDLYSSPSRSQSVIICLLMTSNCIGLQSDSERDACRPSTPDVLHQWPAVMVRISTAAAERLKDIIDLVRLSDIPPSTVVS